MRTYSYKGKSITASSRKEAIQYFAKHNSKKVTASTELDDDLYEKYGQEYINDEGDDGQVFDMSELDEQLGGSSPSEAIMDAYCGYDYTGDGNDNTQFNPNEDYFAFNGQGNLVSIRSGLLTEWLKANIDESYFRDWLKNEQKEEYMDVLRDEVEEEIEKSPKPMSGFEFKKLGYDDVVFDRDDDTLRCFDCSIDYDYDFSLDKNLQALYEEIMNEHPDADEDEE